MGAEAEAGGTAEMLLPSANKMISRVSSNLNDPMIT